MAKVEWLTIKQAELYQLIQEQEVLHLYNQHLKEVEHQQPQHQTHQQRQGQTQLQQQQQEQQHLQQEERLQHQAVVAEVYLEVKAVADLEKDY